MSKNPAELDINSYSQPFSFPTDTLVQLQAPFSSLHTIRTQIPVCLPLLVSMLMS